MEKVTSDEKTDLRRRYKEVRRDIKPADRMRWDAAIAEAVLDLPHVANARVVFAYLSRSGEVDTSALVHEFLRQHKRVITPSPDIRSLPHDGLFRVTPRPDMEGHFPPVLCQESRVNQLDVVLVPGIVWDRTGHRIGFGGGYFDRLLSMVRQDCLKVGLSYGCQIVEQVPREAWDEPVDLLVTEQGIF